MKTSKIGLAALCFALTLSLGAVTGCSSGSTSSTGSGSSSSASSQAQAEATPEQEVEAAVEKSLDPYKDSDPGVVDAMVEAMESADTSSLEQLGITPQQLAVAILSGYDYEITDVTVDGDTAEATVDITAKSMADFTEAASDLAVNMLEDPQQFAGMTTEEINAKAGEMTLDMLNNLEPTTKDGVVLTYEKKDGEWVPTEETAQLISGLYTV